MTTIVDSGTPTGKNRGELTAMSETARRKIAGLIFLKYIADAQETETLAALRDAMLPKLISGELRVEEASRFTLFSSPEPSARIELPALLCGI